MNEVERKETQVGTREDSIRKQEREVREIFEYLIQVLNRMGASSLNQREIRKVYSKTHRTLQQEVMRSLVMPILEELSANYKTGAYDGRNEQSARLASQMLAAVPEEERYLPYV